MNETNLTIMKIEAHTCLQFHEEELKNIHATLLIHDKKLNLRNPQLRF